MMVKSPDISGMGGGYEGACQRMLWLGFEWVHDKPYEVWEGTWSYKNIYGVLHTGDGLKELEKIWSKDKVLNGDFTGAMHQAVMGHLHYAHKNGYKKYIAEFDDDPDRLIESDRDISSKLEKWLLHSCKESVKT